MTERLTRVQQQARTREKLLDSAETLFGEQGIHQTSLDQIAAAAGLTKGAIYANFGAKKDLIAAITERKAAEDRPLPPGETAESFVQEIGKVWEANVDTPEVRRFALAFVELWLHGARNPEEQETLRGWMRTIRANNARDLRDLGFAEPERTAALLLALDLGVAMQRLVDPEAVPAEFYTRGAESVIEAVRPPGGRPPR